MQLLAETPTGAVPRYFALLTKLAALARRSQLLGENLGNLRKQATGGRFSWPTTSAARS